MTDPAAPPSGFAIEADVAMAAGDPDAIGAALTTELCGSWAHSGACRWPHNTRILRIDGSTVRVRSVIAASGADQPEIVERARDALQHPRLQPEISPAPAWQLLRAEVQSLDEDERDLARRIGNVTPT